MKEQMKESELIDMQLHEVKQIRPCMSVIRVIGGWIYETALQGQNGWSSTQVFVPEKR